MCKYFKEKQLTKVEKSEKQAYHVISIPLISSAERTLQRQKEGSTVGFWYEIRKKYVTIFSSLSIIITTKLYLKDLKGSYSDLDVPKLKI